MRTIIRGATLVTDGRAFRGSLVVEGKEIAEVLEGDALPEKPCDSELDATGMYLIPGIIDDHVHFRDPGLTHKADIITESRAAAAGGVTSYMDMPNTLPQTTTLEALENKLKEAAGKSRVNFSFFFGATNDNAPLVRQLDRTRVPGLKLFMGSSTGNMLVDNDNTLRQLFSEVGMIIMTHCEDQTVIKTNTDRYKALYGEDLAVEFHPDIRSEEACYRSTERAVRLARETGAHLHVAHLSTARELELFEARPLDEKRITAEACVAHLRFTDKDYATLGTRIKCNPAIKGEKDRDALRRALTDGRIDLIGTDHAPHLLEEKQGGALKAVSGMPMVQFSLVAMLELVDEGVLTLEELVEKMCHAPARLFHIRKRGYLRPGYRADLVLIRPDTPWVLTPERILSKCGWSPLEGHRFQWTVEQTMVNGETVYADGRVIDTVRGEELAFDN